MAPCVPDNASVAAPGTTWTPLNSGSISPSYLWSDHCLQRSTSDPSPVELRFLSNFDSPQCIAHWVRVRADRSRQVHRRSPNMGWDLLRTGPLPMTMAGEWGFWIFFKAVFWTPACSVTIVMLAPRHSCDCVSIR